MTPIEIQQFVYDLCYDLTKSEDRAKNELDFTWRKNKDGKNEQLVSPQMPLEVADGLLSKLAKQDIIKFEKVESRTEPGTYRLLISAPNIKNIYTAVINKLNQRSETLTTPEKEFNWEYLPTPAGNAFVGINLTTPHSQGPAIAPLYLLSEELNHNLSSLSEKLKHLYGFEINREMHTKGDVCYLSSVTYAGYKQLTEGPSLVNLLMRQHPILSKDAASNDSDSDSKPDESQVTKPPSA